MIFFHKSKNNKISKFPKSLYDWVNDLFPSWEYFSPMNDTTLFMGSAGTNLRPLNGELHHKLQLQIQNNLNLVRSVIINEREYFRCLKQNKNTNSQKFNEIDSLVKRELHSIAKFDKDPNKLLDAYCLLRLYDLIPHSFNTILEKFYTPQSQIGTIDEVSDISKKNYSRLFRSLILFRIFEIRFDDVPLTESLVLNDIIRNNFLTFHNDRFGTGKITWKEDPTESVLAFLKIYHRNPILRELLQTDDNIIQKHMNVQRQERVKKYYKEVGFPQFTLFEKWLIIQEYVKKKFQSDAKLLDNAENEKIKQYFGQMLNMKMINHLSIPITQNLELQFITKQNGMMHKISYFVSGWLWEQGLSMEIDKERVNKLNNIFRFNEQQYFPLHDFSEIDYKTTSEFESLDSNLIIESLKDVITNLHYVLNDKNELLQCISDIHDELGNISYSRTLYEKFLSEKEFFEMRLEFIYNDFMSENDLSAYREPVDWSKR